MPYKLRVFECAGCGQQVERRGPPESQQRCIHCSIRRAAENNIQLHHKSGPFYQRWMAGMMAGVAREQQLAALAADIDGLDLRE